MTVFVAVILNKYCFPALSQSLIKNIRSVWSESDCCSNHVGPLEKLLKAEFQESNAVPEA